jgi:hypothetical protein
MRIAYAYGVSVGAGHTFTFTSVGGYAYGQVYAISGTLTTAAVFHAGTDKGVAIQTSPFQPGSITPADGDIIITGWGTNTSGSTSSINDSFVIGFLAVGLGQGAYLITQVAPNPLNPTWTTNTSGAQCCSAIAAFSAAP